MFVSPTGWERTVVVEEVLYTFGVVFLACVEYGLRAPRSVDVSLSLFACMLLQAL